MSGMMDRISGRLKKAAGDLADDPGLRDRGAQEERKADAKDELARAQQEADLKAEEVARLERQTAGGGSGAAGDNAGERPDHAGEAPGRPRREV